MARLIEPEDLLDPAGVAELLGLAHAQSVRIYADRYPDMPAPFRVFGQGRRQYRIWLRQDLVRWHATRRSQAPAARR